MLVLFCHTYFFTIIFDATVARQIHITVRENVTRYCPGQHFELIDQKTVNVHFEIISLVDGADQLSITEQNGNTRTIALPGCFRARLNFWLRNLLVNPYIELFLQFGTNIPCKIGENEVTDSVTHICANITREDWCPKSDNRKLRSMLKGKSTCRFCNLCRSLKLVDRYDESYIYNEGPDQCNSTSPFKTFVFKICTPPLKILREKNRRYSGLLEDYWNYLKQGIMTAVVHIMDRSQLEKTRLQQCERLCTVYRNQRSISGSYLSALQRSIENLCSPADSHVACIYQTIKFDVVDD